MRLIFLASFVSTFALLGTFASAQPAAAAPGEYKIQRTLKIGGAGRWDYLAVGPDHRLYVTRSTHTQVIDSADGKVVADVAGGAGLHGVAVVPSVGKAYVTDGRDAKILVIDLKSYALLGSIDAADDADGIIYDPASDRLLISCGDANQLLVLDPHADVATAKVEKVELDGKPEFLAADRKGRAFVCVNDKNVIAVIDLKTLKVTDRWPCGSGTAPTGLALDAKGGRLFVGCRNEKLIAMDSANGKVLAELPIGRGNDACAYDEEARLAFASGGDGTLAVICETVPGTLVVQQTLATRAGARTLAIDGSTHALYLPTAEFAPAEPGKRAAPLPDSFQIVVVEAASAH